MRILIIDNNTKHIEQLKALCKSHAVDVLKWDKISADSYMEYDLVILSGGKGLAIDKHEKDLEKEINLVKNSNKPIIGICLGFEIVCHVFGCKMEREEEREKGIIEIEVLADDIIFSGKKKLKVSMAHKWHIKEVDSVLVPLARTEKGIDVIKHNSKPIYGFQFHPEITEPQNDGEMIFNNCLSELEAI